MFLNMITEKINQKFWQKIHHSNINVNLTEEYVILIKSGITINVDASVKNILYVKKIIFGILLLVLAEMENV